MWSFLPEDQYWIVEPLIEAGVALDEVRELVFRLAFEAITGGVASVVAAHGLVADRPVHVRAAWDETLGRMIQAHEPTAPRIDEPQGRAPGSV